MRELLDAILSALEAGGSAILCTIVSRTGTTPRGAGVAMTVDESGAQAGTVGGGEAEYHVRQDALALLQARSSEIRTYPIHSGAAECCNEHHGGSIDVLFRTFAGEEGNLLAKRARTVLNHEEGYLVCKVTNGKPGESEVVPAWMAKDDPVLRPYLADAPVFTAEEPRLLIEPLFPAPRVIVLGGGHVAKALVPILAFLKYRVWVVEDRDEINDPSRFPQAERVLCEVQNMVLGELELTERDHIVSLVRGRGTDFFILDAALRTRAGYIGAIGSHANARRLRDQLLSRGFSKEQVARIHSPVGLDIGAESPEEIAVSVAAELIAFESARRNGGKQG